MRPELTTEPAPAVSSDAAPAPPGLVEFIRRRLAASSEALHEEAHRELDRILLPLEMEHIRGNQFQAAMILGVARQILRRRLRELQITPRFSDDSADDSD
jgi:DNA-binding NtrC family response regulator